MGILPKFKWGIGIFLIATIVFLKINTQEGLAFLNNKEVVIVDNGFEFKIRAIGNTSEEILRNAGIFISEKDLIFPTELKEGEKIIILRAIPVNLNFLGKEEKFFTREKTVGDFLKENNIDIKREYVLNYNLEDEIFPEMTIKILRKSEEKKEVKFVISPLKNNPPKPSLVKNNSSIGNNFSQNSYSLNKGPAQIGLASWYSYIPGNYCASLTYPKGTKLLVTNLANGRSVVVIVNDRGPYVGGRVIDLERNAFSQIGSLSSGVINVKVERIY